MKAIIKLDVPDYQIGQEVSIYFKDTMMIKGVVQKPKAKVGKWIKEKSIYGWDGYPYQCSECGRSIHIDTKIEDLSDYPYCHCGADMREGVQE